MLIHNDAELKRAFLMKLLPGLMEDLSKKVEDILKRNLNLASISTDTIQDYVTHTIENKGDKITATIFIDDVAAQYENEGSKEWYAPVGNGVLRQFMSIDGSTDYGGHTIVWNIINWLEETGASGRIGNNPIMPIEMFANTEQEVRTNLDNWVKEYLHKQGL